ncbi:hypothetical protein [Tardiphaga sp. 42S5]|uniref:hypothetical protein n=1 Tax=Tardiphaga sp. 42S5 TaxID=1404799 RepID=UPI002A5A48BA|nr:hypothetical protein [Tardiphaga sp. 42S5]WPO39795.1 hypothetical protein SFY93_19875 [Tardiphaga sp. 42S5]
MANPTYQAINRIAEETLKSHGHTSVGKAMRSRDLVDAIQNEIKAQNLDVVLARSSIFNYISHAANKDESSAIFSGGAWGGYWVQEEAPAPEKPVEKAEIQDVQNAQKVSFSERDLYPLVSSWLQTKGFTSKDVSTLKGGGKWGNPDIVGVKKVDLFGSIEIEVASCEVKLSETGWEQYIFEAISHKRFSNRSWFVYRIGDAGRALPKAIDYYAERYKVGVVQIFLNDAELIELKQKKEGIAGEFLDRVNERIPAFYEQVPLQEKADLFDRAKIVPSSTFVFE